MEPEHEKLLNDLYKLTKENNVMLKKVRRTQKAGTIFSILYWLIIIGIALGAFFFLEPYVEKIMTVYNQASGGISSLNADISNFESSFTSKTK